jgi:hypothetical protein
MWLVWETGDVHIPGLVRNPEGKKPLGRPRPTHGRIVLKWILKKWDRETWTGLISLRIGTGGGHL